MNAIILALSGMPNLNCTRICALLAIDGDVPLETLFIVSIFPHGGLDGSVPFDMKMGIIIQFIVNHLVSFSCVTGRIALSTINIENFVMAIEIRQSNQ